MLRPKTGQELTTETGFRQGRGSAGSIAISRGYEGLAGVGGATYFLETVG